MKQKNLLEVLNVIALVLLHSTNAGGFFQKLRGKGEDRVVIILAACDVAAGSC